MAELLRNKQINVWRGNDTPPTKYHLWVYDDTKLRLFDGSAWQTFLDNPGLTVKDNPDGSVTVANGNSSFTLIARGTGLALDHEGSVITLTSSAITNIGTDDWLEWKNKTLYHKLVNLETKEFGPVTDSSNSLAFSVPYISVDDAGHVVNGGTHSVTIPAQVAQNPVSDTDTKSYPVLLATTDEKGSITGEANKDVSLSLKVAYDGSATTKTLVTQGIEALGEVKVTGGNLKVDTGYYIEGNVKGNVEGTALPKEHASIKPDYGIGTSANPNAGVDAVDASAFYGHVKLEDTLPTEEPVAGWATENVNGGVAAGKGIAATPLMVYRAVNASKDYSDSLFGDDFSKQQDGKYNISWIEIT